MAMAEAMLSLKLLGERSLWHGEHDASGEIHYRKGWALLGYLAVERGRLHAREQIASLLWPNLAPASGRTNLRQVVADLNQLFESRDAGAVLDISRESIGLFPEAASGVCIDLMSIERVASLPAAPTEADVLAVECDSAAVGGEFMSGLELDDCADFGQWLAAARRQLAHAAQEALARLARAQQALGRLPQAISTTRKLVAMDTWHEGYVRQLMALLAASGLHAQALESYRVLEASLRSELGITPEARTQALRAEVEADQRRLLPVSGSGAPAPHSLAAQVRRWLDELAGNGIDGSEMAVDLRTQRTLALTGSPRSGNTARGWLEVEGSGGTPRRVELSATPVVIGRSRDSDVCIAHDTVSRQHCVVWDGDGVFRVRDLGSTNGTRVNDATVQEAALGNGDRILLGGTVLRFRCRALTGSSGCSP